MEQSKAGGDFRSTAKDVLAFSLAFCGFMGAIAGAAKAPEIVGDVFGWSDPTKQTVAYTIVGGVILIVGACALQFVIKRLLLHLSDRPLPPLDGPSADAYRALARVVIPQLQNKRRAPGVMIAGITCKATIMKFSLEFLHGFVERHLQPLTREIARESDTLDAPIRILAAQVARLAGELQLFRESVAWAFDHIKDLPDFPDDTLDQLGDLIKKFKEIEEDILNEPRIDHEPLDDEELEQKRQARVANFEQRAKSLDTQAEKLRQLRKLLLDGHKKCHSLCLDIQFLPTD